MGNNVNASGRNLSSAKKALLEKWLRGRLTANGGSAPIPRRPPGEEAPPSFAQQRLWFLYRLEPESAAYNLPVALQLEGRLDLAALEKSLDEIVRRHEVLRTTFRSSDGQPLQRIAAAAATAVASWDLSGLSQSGRDAELRRLIEDMARRPFDLERGPLLRIGLARLDEDRRVLLFAVHHSVFDGWSASVLTGEFAALYRAFRAGLPSPLPEMSLQYADYAVWQRDRLESGELEQQSAYWRKQLAGAPPLLDLPTDYLRPSAQSYRGGMFRFRVSDELAQALRALGRRQDATLFMALLAAFEALLYRYSGQSDLCVGTPVANRTRKELEGLIGCFVNTLVLRTDLSGNPTFGEALMRVRETCLEAQTHEDVPFEKLVEEFRPERNPSYHPLIQVMFVLQNLPAEPLHLPDLEIKPLSVETRTSPFDLTLTFTERADGLDGSIEYSSDLFEEDTIVRFAGRYLRILECISADSEIHIDELPLLTEAERRQLTEWSGTTRLRFDQRELHGPFEAQAAHWPERTALVCGARRLSYGELNALADRLAFYLRTKGIGAEVRVGVCAERSVEAIVGILGILKAGGAYVPLDPAQPRERTAELLEDCGAALLLSQEHLAVRLPTGVEVVFLDAADWRPENQLPGSDLRSAVCGHRSPASDLRTAYLIYTSGSTGKPKGVVVSHANATASTAARFAFYPEPVKSFLLLSPFAFDSSVAGIFWTLGQGGCLCIPPEASLHEPGSLAGLIEREGVSHVLGLPSLYGLLLDEGAERMRTLRVAIVAGETCPPALVVRHCERLSGTRLYNEYGPTEGTVWSSACELRAADAASGKPIAIGRPIGDVRIHILDARLNPVAIGVPGEIYLGGAGVARGYHGRPELTASCFIPDPFATEPGGRLYRTGDRARFRSDGAIEFLGRVDHQVKIRGFRIEPGEIEVRLLLHPDVKEALVIAREDRPGDRRLVAYVVPVRGMQDGVEAGEHGRFSEILREFLKDALPDYMVPSVFVPLGELPRNANGKPDRRALPPPDIAGQFGHRQVEPRNPVEAGLAEIWAELLGLERVGVHDNFFELGGHSLSAVQAIVRIHEKFGIELGVSSLFDAPTIAKFALLMTQRQAEQHDAGELEALLRELERLPEGEAQPWSQDLQT